MRMYRDAQMPAVDRLTRVRPDKRITLALVVAVLVAFTTRSAKATEDCSDGDQLTQVQCVSRQIELVDKTMNEVYQRALQTFPNTNSHDTRKEREQLRRSQRAWLQFKRANCALIGGLRGGSNLAVSHFAALCEKKAIEERIRFLEEIVQFERD